MNGGKLESNNADIDKIVCGGVMKTVGGTFEWIAGHVVYGGSIYLSDVDVNEISLSDGGICEIKGSNVGTVHLGTDGASIVLTIGDINKEVDENETKINKIVVDTGPLMDTEIIFNNGKIWDLDDDLKEGIKDGVSGTDEGLQIRDGYKVRKTTDGYILVPQT